ncbi:MAG: deoxyhypusine synthase family protein [Candidatus Pacebacteria bacterium]|jgi:deoxyhypusine synthase|nr:deoxyhypusine synthase family protein [Candidatus Paceibacterota bacterium]
MENKEQYKAIKEFVERNFQHFNAAAVKDASRAYVQYIKDGNKIFLAMAGAMSTAELGMTLAEMIRQDKIHAISTTGANLEEDIFNLVARDFYKRVPDYRYLTKEDEENLLKQHLNRVTDTCIPEEEAMRRVEAAIKKYWKKAEEEGKRYFPYEYIYQVIRGGDLRQYYQIDPKDSWVIAAYEKNIPIFVGGWEDSTLGNEIVADLKMGNLKSTNIVKTGLEAMAALIDWYKENTKNGSVGFFQIGGGIAGDFSICVVPLLEQDLFQKDIKKWGYFCQISDSTTSYGSYSGAVPNEKITWGKLSKETPSFVIESDATIVAPLMFAYILSE